MQASRGMEKSRRRQKEMMNEKAKREGRKRKQNEKGE